jgi:EmrB/QacA subfamily drug resistance transporter
LTRELSTRQKVAATTGVMLALLLASLDQTVVGTAMPRIVAELNGISIYAWVTTGYMVAMAVMVPIAGKLGDMFGRKPFILVGMIGFMASSWLCGLSQNMTELVVFRAVQGLFGGALMTNAFTVLADIFTVEQRTKMQGLFGGVFGLSSVIGPFIGGSITDHWTWRWVFYVNIPVGVVAVAVVLAALPYVRSRATWREIDFVGAALLAAGVVPFLVGLTITNDHAWGSPEVISLLAVGAVMLVLFFLYEVRMARNPIVPFELFKINQFTIMVTVAFFSAIGMFGTMIFVPLLYQGVLSVSATNSGTFIVPMMGSMMVFATLSGQVITRVRYYRFLGTLGIALMMAAMWLLAQITPDSSQWQPLWGLILMGAGLGLTFPMANAVVQASLPRQFVGVGTSQVQFWRTLGGTVGTAVLGSILARQLSPDIQSRVSALHLPPQLRLPAGSTGNPQAITDPSFLAQARAALPAVARPLFDQAVHAMRFGLADALHDVFLIGGAVMVLALVATLFLREVSLRSARRAPQPAAGRAADDPRLGLALAAITYLVMKRRGPVPQPVVDAVSTTLDNYVASRRGAPPQEPGDGAPANGTDAPPNGALTPSRDGWRTSR